MELQAYGLIFLGFNSRPDHDSVPTKINVLIFPKCPKKRNPSLQEFSSYGD